MVFVKGNIGSAAVAVRSSSKTDRQVFLDGLADSCETYRIKLIAYVLMFYHFHLLIQTPQINNLSEFI